MTAPTFLPVPRRTNIELRNSAIVGAVRMLIDGVHVGYFSTPSQALFFVAEYPRHPADWPVDQMTDANRDALALTARIEAIAAAADAKSANPFTADAITRLIGGGR